VNEWINECLFFLPAAAGGKLNAANGEEERERLKGVAGPTSSLPRKGFPAVGAQGAEFARDDVTDSSDKVEVDVGRRACADAGPDTSAGADSEREAADRDGPERKPLASALLSVFRG
jgi:hypothetical protein